MTKPKRIQLSRKRGWKKPPGAVVVSRPSMWGNPFTVAQFGAHDAVEHFRSHVATIKRHGGDLKKWTEPLRGKDLCCWCPLNQPCHADILLEIAND